MVHDRSRPSRRLTPRGDWLRLLDQLARLAGGAPELMAHRESAWASATFTGSRHAFTLAFAGAEAVARGEALIAKLDDHEFALPGQIVADASVTEAYQALVPEPRLELTCELLVVEGI